MNSDSFKKCYLEKSYMYKQDLALNNLSRVNISLNQ